MTATIDYSETNCAPPDLRSAGRLLALLQEAVDAVADVDPDELDSRLSAGRGLLDLAACARAAIAELGANPGTVVTEAPGVVVVRELVAATRMLAAAIV